MPIVVDCYDLGDDLVEEVAVVRDGQHGSFEVLQGGLQYFGRGMSRLLVGSSSSRKFASVSIRRAICRRLFSPPLNRPNEGMDILVGEEQTSARRRWLAARSSA